MLISNNIYLQEKLLKKALKKNSHKLKYFIEIYL